jgi:hypothetical protein
MFLLPPATYALQRHQPCAAAAAITTCRANQPRPQALSDALGYVEALLPSHRDDMALIEALDGALSAARGCAKAGLTRNTEDAAAIEAALMRVEALLAAGDARALFEAEAGGGAAAARKDGGGGDGGASVQAEGVMGAGAADALRVLLLRQAQVRRRDFLAAAARAPHMNLAHHPQGTANCRPMTFCNAPHSRLYASPQTRDAQTPVSAPCACPRIRLQALQQLSSTGLRASAVDTSLASLGQLGGQSPAGQGQPQQQQPLQQPGLSSSGGAASSTSGARSPSPPPGGAKKGAKPAPGGKRPGSSEASERRPSAPGGRGKRVSGDADARDGGGFAAGQLGQSAAPSLFSDIAGVINGCTAVVQEAAGAYYASKVG